MSLAGSNSQFSDKIKLAFGGQRVRAFVAHPNANGAAVDIWSISETDAFVSSVLGYAPLQARRVDGTTAGALVARAEPNGHVIDYVRVDDGDITGSSPSVVALMQPVVTLGGLNARFDRVPQSTEDVVLLVTHRPITNDPFQARFAYVAPSQAPVATVVFDNSSSNANLGAGDYDPSAFFRDASGANHAIFRQTFDGANIVRHFVIPDSVAGIVAPAVNEDGAGAPLFLGIHPRADGD